MNTELFLTSSVHAVAHDIAARMDDIGSLAFIRTAVETIDDDDMNWLENDRNALINAGFSVQDYTITGKTADQIKQELSAFDALYFSGGDTAYTLKQSQLSGCIPVIRKLILEDGKVYIGTSAGSIIAGPRLTDYLAIDAPDITDTTAYGLVNFTLVPHWGDADFRERYLERRLPIAYHEKQVPLIALSDTQYCHVKNGAMTIVDVNLL